ncbi:hypothetical protein DUNSADRAFT_10575 [Dunaliella salina]|uniref:Uncharacterized protein n=1 Tax=Dunaliella salina TaxID=3046 RepID=A0ABQ7H4U0_DUNSA|nr:hypothetical protein DUNSADRAFT_10575 [Dunaliella salina]|eukprot:KAF5841869.1 hypothetical protein DUNSADRAFT_10575 [Dunaliella salina]
MGLRAMKHALRAWGNNPPLLCQPQCLSRAGISTSQNLHSVADVDEQPLEDQTLKETQNKILRELHALEGAAAAFFRGQNLAARGRVDMATFYQQEQEALARLQELLPACRVRPSLLQGALQAAGLGFGAIAGLTPRSINLAVMGAVQDILQEQYNDALREVRAAGGIDGSSGSSGHQPESVSMGEGPEQERSSSHDDLHHATAPSSESSDVSSTAGDTAPSSYHQGPGRSDHCPDSNGVREVLRDLRDFDRAPHGAPIPPDIMAIQGMYDKGRVSSEEAAGFATKLCGQLAKTLLSTTRL